MTYEDRILSSILNQDGEEISDDAEAEEEKPEEVKEEEEEETEEIE